MRFRDRKILVVITLKVCIKHHFSVDFRLKKAKGKKKTRSMLGLEKLSGTLFFDKTVYKMTWNSMKWSGDHLVSYVLRQGVLQWPHWKRVGRGGGGYRLHYNNPFLVFTDICSFLSQLPASLTHNLKCVQFRFCVCNSYLELPDPQTEPSTFKSWNFSFSNFMAVTFVLNMLLHNYHHAVLLSSQTMWNQPQPSSCWTAKGQPAVAPPSALHHHRCVSSCQQQKTSPTVSEHSSLGAGGFPDAMPCGAVLRAISSQVQVLQVLQVLQGLQVLPVKEEVQKCMRKNLSSILLFCRMHHMFTESDVCRKTQQPRQDWRNSVCLKFSSILFNSLTSESPK